MTSVRPFASAVVLSSAALATLAWAAADANHNSHHAATTTLVAQAQPASPDLGMMLDRTESVPAPK